MALTTIGLITSLANIDFFGVCRGSDRFVGRPFYIDYSKLHILVNDKHKQDVGGIPEGCFLLCSYDREKKPTEVVLVRVLGPTKLPTDQDVIAAMVDYYKESAPTAKIEAHLDSFTRNEFQFSGLECRVLGTFYHINSGSNEGKIAFGSDIENFYSANNYSVYKPSGEVLEYIVNFKGGGGVVGGVEDARIGEVRYSSTVRIPPVPPVPVYVSATDFLAKRTALFGMTRTGKSNTVKKIIQCVEYLSESKIRYEDEELAPVGQIIFDVNGEYANPNRQDEGTAIYELYKSKVTRYSTIQKDQFKVMMVNFYKSVDQGFGLLQGLLSDDASDYVRAFRSLDFSLDEDYKNDRSYNVRRDRRIAAYKCCLKAAEFPENLQHREQVKFQGHAALNALSGRTINPSTGISLDDAIAWFTSVWEQYSTNQFFSDYFRSEGHQWADEDLKTLMLLLTLKKENNTRANISGYKKLIPGRKLHTQSIDKLYEDEILDLLREGKIVIVDLSEGDPLIQRTYSERICERIFTDGMHRFISNPTNVRGKSYANFIQMYFEEAHNLFPKKDDKDLAQVYNRLAKEGAKLRIGLNYATQEVSSISSNILKNTQNWFISHLNNKDELKEIEKFYDFEDFTGSLQRATDKGFIRMKTYSNAFIVPVQIDRFTAKTAKNRG